MARRNGCGGENRRSRLASLEAETSQRISQVGSGREETCRRDGGIAVAAGLRPGFSGLQHAPWAQAMKARC